MHLHFQEWYTVIDKEGKSKERYLFLFKARILVCKVRRISEDRSVFVLKDIIRVNNTYELENDHIATSQSIWLTALHCIYFLLPSQLPEVEVKDHPDDVRSFELHNPAIPNYPITLVAHKDPVKACWLKEIRQYASDVVALAEHAADDLQVTEEESKEESKDDEKQVPVKIEPSRTSPARAQDNPTKREVKAAEETKPKVDSNDSTKNIAERRKDYAGATDTSEVEKTKVKETEADMSRRYSASRYSASAKVVEGELPSLGKLLSFINKCEACRIVNLYNCKI